MAHTHSVVDSDNHFVIDPVTRTVQNNSNKVWLVQNDHNSERFTFECPRFIEGHDMSLCDSIKVLYINLNKKTQEETCGIYEVDDLAINFNNLEQITFSWLISRNATSYVGSLTFMVQMTCISDDGTVDYCWQTGITKGITIVDGMDNEETIVEDYPDILQKWKNDILGEIPELAPQTVKKLESPDKGNPMILRDLDSGGYILYGHFKPYTGSDATMEFSSHLLANVIKRTTDSHVQIFYPYNNCVQYLKITDAAYERQNIYLNDLATKEYVDQSVPTDEETVQELLDADVLPAVTVNGEILTDENGNILMW